MMRLAIPVLRASSAEAAEAFYGGKLGFTRAFAYRIDESRADPCYQGFTRDGAALHVSSFPGDGLFGSVAHFVVDDVDALFEEFKQAGVTCEPPVDQTWRVRELHVADPDGNRLRFGQELD